MTDRSLMIIASGRKKLLTSVERALFITGMSTHSIKQPAITFSFLTVLFVLSALIVASAQAQRPTRGGGTVTPPPQPPADISPL
jgi:hypothetical protein